METKCSACVCHHICLKVLNKTMFTAHKYIDHERRKREGNVKEGELAFSFKNGNTFEIYCVYLNNQLNEITLVKVKQAGSRYTEIFDLTIHEFWQKFTTRKHNLK